MPKALITGATGLLGRAVVKAFIAKGYEVTGTCYARDGTTCQAAGARMMRLDLTSDAVVRAVVTEREWDVVVHCAANRNPDACNADPEAARRLNVTTTATLASSCAARGILLIYISTDYVFPGTPGHAPYAATDVPAPTNIYGQTKLEGEVAVRNAFKVANSNSKGRSKGVSFRVPVLYGEAEANGESAVNCLVDAVRKAQERVVRMEGWARRVPTNVGDVGRVLADTATLYLSTSPADSLPEILQFSSEDVMTKWEICEVFADLLGVGMGKMVPDIPKIGEGSGAVQRPYDCHLSTDELKKLGIDVSTVNFRDWWRGYLKREKGEAAA